MNASSIKRTRGAALAAAVVAGALTLPAIAGDFNGDGFDDLAIGVPGDVVGGIASGSISVVYGAGTGLESLAPARVLAPQVLHEGAARAAGDMFGFSLASGDFNNDGFDDLAVGAPSAAGGVGRVRVFYGAAGGLNTGCASAAFLHPAPVVGDLFAFALAAGDFNQDGFDDLAIGAPNDDAGMGIANAGSVVVLFGSAACAGLTTAGAEFIHQGVAGDAPQVNDHFGAALAAADFNCDLADDLAISADGETLAAGGEGAVSVIHGQAALGFFPALGPAPQFWHEAALGGAPAMNDHFGRAITVGDLDGNGAPDLAVGVPNKDIAGVADTGMVAVIYAACGVGLQTGAPAPQFWHQNSPGVNPGANGAADRFGSALAAGDFQNDGADDLLIGVPGDTVGAAQNGSAYVLHGLAGAGIPVPAIAERLHQNADAAIPEANAANDNQGASVAAGDFNGDGFMDLAWGTPNEDFGALVNAGYVNTMYGSPALFLPVAAPPVLPEGLRRGGAGIGAPGGQIIPLNGGPAGGDNLGLSVTSNR